MTSSSISLKPASAASAAAAAAAAPTATLPSQRMGSSLDSLVRVSLEEFNTITNSRKHQSIVKKYANPLLFEPERSPVKVDSSRWDGYLQKLEEAKANIQQIWKDKLSNILSDKSLPLKPKANLLRALLKLLLDETTVLRESELQAGLSCKYHEVVSRYRRGNQCIGNTVRITLDDWLYNTPDEIDFCWRFMKIVDETSDNKGLPHLVTSVREPDRSDLEIYSKSTNPQVRALAEKALLALDEALYEQQLLPAQLKWIDLVLSARPAPSAFSESDLESLAPGFFYDLQAVLAIRVAYQKMKTDKLDNIAAESEAIAQFQVKMHSLLKTFPSNAQFCWDILDALKGLRQKYRGREALEFGRDYICCFDEKMPAKAAIPPPFSAAAAAAVASVATEAKKKKKKKRQAAAAAAASPGFEMKTDEPPPPPKEEVIISRYPLKAWLKEDLPYRWLSRVSEWFQQDPSAGRDYFLHAFPTAVDRVLLQKQFCYLEVEPVLGHMPKKHYRAIVQITLPDQDPMLAVVTISTFTRDDGIEICYHHYCSHRKPTEIVGRAMEQIAKKLERIEMLPGAEDEEVSTVTLNEGSIDILSDPTSPYVTLRDASTRLTITIFPKRGM